jgi:hypothetical protein
MIYDYFPEVDGNQSVDFGKLGRKLHKGGGGGATTSTTKMEPAAEVKPYLAPFLNQAWGVSNQPYETYQGQRIANLTPEQYMSSGLTSAQALNGFQGQGDAFGNFQSTMRGDYMNPDSNPWLQANAQKAMGDISNAYRMGTKPQTDAAFSRAGAFGGSAWNSAVNNNERTLADSLGNTANQFYGQNYLNERNNQMQGLNMLPTMQNVGYTDASKLAGVGDNFRQYQQDLLNTNYSDWQEAQNYPTRMLDIFGNQLRATMGAGGSTSTSQSGGYKPSPFASALGGGVAGYGLGGAAGAGLGALGGLLM